MLSHRNIQANRFQLAARIDFGPTTLSSIPAYLSFIWVNEALCSQYYLAFVLFITPRLYYRIVPELIYDTNATMNFGTDTFSRLRALQAYDFYSLRYLLERRKTQNYPLSGQIIMACVCLKVMAPQKQSCCAINTYASSQALGACQVSNTRSLQSYRKWHRLTISGPNIMQNGLSTQPGILAATKKQSYDTGDIVSIDAEGFISIQGHMKRFAKIAGEMICRILYHACWPDHLHAVIAVQIKKRRSLTTIYAM